MTRRIVTEEVGDRSRIRSDGPVPDVAVGAVWVTTPDDRIGSVIVEPGDCVIQRGTNHAWRNHGDAPIRLIAFMIGTD